MKEATVRLMNINEACVYTSMGKSFFRTWAKQIGAEMKFSQRCVRYDKTIIDKALNQMKGEENENIN